jgi:hypothetical protein
MQVQPPNPEHKRMKRERQTIAYMTEIYCHNKHETPKHELCTQCREFQEYAFLRLSKCPFQEKKSTCGKCTIHCYRPDMKEKVRIIMRYSGPRMLLSHPGMALHHAWDARRKPPTLIKLEVINTS